MSFSRIIDVVLKVLTNKYVIFICVVVFLYLNFVCYIVRYRKKKRVLIKRKMIVTKKETESDKTDDKNEVSDSTSSSEAKSTVSNLEDDDESK